MIGLLVPVFTTVIAFILVWIASDFILKSISRIAKTVHMSSFAISFILLGVLTSVPELSIGLNAIIEQKPGVYVGNLIGATFVIFTLIIPLLAIAGNGIVLSHNLSLKYLFFTLCVIFMPTLFAADGQVGRIEAIAMILLYVILITFLDKRQSVREKARSFFSRFKAKDALPNVIDFIKIAAGSLVIFFASRLLVTQVLFFSQEFNIAPLLIGLLVIAVGTNIPELFIGLRSILNHDKGVAFGDYLGSAAVNTFLFGVLTLINGPVVAQDHFFYISFLLAVGLIFFFVASWRNNDVSRLEGLVLLGVYLAFLYIEIGL